MFRVTASVTFTDLSQEGAVTPHRSSRWATIIPSIAVPLSIIGTFGVMSLLNYNLDNLSLMALAICTGFVVDDAIVVIENDVPFLVGLNVVLIPAEVNGTACAWPFA